MVNPGKALGRALIGSLFIYGGRNALVNRQHLTGLIDNAQEQYGVKEKVPATSEQLIQAKLDRELLEEYEHEFAEYGVDVHDEEDMAALGITTPAPKTEFIKFEAALKVLARRQKVKAGQN